TVNDQDDDLGSSTKTLGVTVNNVAPTLSVVGSQSVKAGQLLSLVNLGTFTDPGADTFKYSIDWGDTSIDNGDATIDQISNPSLGLITHGSFDGSHTFATAGTYTVKVSLTDDDGGTTMDMFDVF